MNFGEQSFRDETAKTLKAMSKEDRLPFLADLKIGSYEYQAAHYFHALDVNRGLMTERISTIVSDAGTLDELKKKLSAEELLIANEFNGAEHGEHIAKRIEMAEATGCVLLVPEDGGLAKKVEDLITASGQERSERVDQEAYRAYLRDRFPNLNFSEAQWKKVAQKLPAETFASVDVAMGRSTLLLNSIDETKSLFSCAGHGERAEKIATEEQYFESSYAAFATKQETLLADFQKEFDVPSVVSVEVSDETFTPELIGAKRVVLRFRQLPPLAWLAANGKRTTGEIERDCRKALSRDFDEMIPDDISDRDYFELLERLQRRYLQALPEATLRQEANSKLFREMQQYYPLKQMYIEYAEYYRSKAAEAVRNDFIHRAEQVVERYRAGARSDQMKQYGQG